MSRSLLGLLGLLLGACGEKPDDALPVVPPDTGTTTVEPCQEQRWFADADGDGFGDPYAMVVACQPPEGHVADATDCDDTDAELRPDRTWYADVDDDGFGDPEAPYPGCHPPLDHVADATDCDDSDPRRHPDAVWFRDADEDGFGDDSDPRSSCDDVAGATPEPGDCDDMDPQVHPAGAEVCDFIDNDCDGLTDDEDASVDEFTRVLFYEDLDGDDHGSDIELGMSCLSSDPGALVSGDCDDGDPTVHPGRLELPDEIDQNCDGESTFHMLQDVDTGVRTSALGAGAGAHGLTADLDGDTLLDILIQGPEADEAAGRLVLLGATAARDLSDLGGGDRTWVGAAPGDQLGGRPGTAVGDMDGDGQVDLLVAAPGADSGAGVVYLLDPTTPSGDIDIAATWSWTGPDTSTGLGDLISLGDIDGDGLDDALATSATYDGGGRDRGIAWLLTGASVSVSADPAAGGAVAGESNYHAFGSSPVRAGDMDGDGIEEVLLGAPGVSDRVQVDGRVYRVPATALADAAFSLPDSDRYVGESIRSRLGKANRAIGDFTGDGYADALVRSEHTIAGYGSGTAYLLGGAAVLDFELGVADTEVRFANDLPSLTFAGDDQLGEDVSVGDLDGDGAADLFIGAPGADLSASYSNDGVVAVFMGGPRSGDLEVLGDADVLLHGVRQYTGAPILPAGDLDADGLPDAWVGQTGGDLTLRLLSGADFP